MITAQIFQQENPISIDTTEGQSVVLECRFDRSQLRTFGFTKMNSIWRKVRSKSDLVAFNSEYFDQSYNVTNDVSNGVYDLTIKSATYDHDNFNFECVLKQSGTRQEFIVASYMVTVLSKFA